MGVKDYYTVLEIAAYLGIGRTKAYSLTQQYRATGEGIPVVLIGGALRVPRDKFEAWTGQPIRNTDAERPAQAPTESTYGTDKNCEPIESADVIAAQPNVLVEATEPKSVTAEIPKDQITEPFSSGPANAAEPVVPTAAPTVDRSPTSSSTAHRKRTNRKRATTTYQMSLDLTA